MYLKPESNMSFFTQFDGRIHSKLKVKQAPFKNLTIFLLPLYTQQRDKIKVSQKFIMKTKHTTNNEKNSFARILINGVYTASLSLYVHATTIKFRMRPTSGIHFIFARCVFSSQFHKLVFLCIKPASLCNKDDIVDAINYLLK